MADLRGGQPGGDGPDAVDRLDDLVEGVVGRADQVRPEDAALLRSIERLRALAHEPLPEASRERHLLTIRTAAQQVAAGPEPRARGRRARLRRQTIALAAATVAMLVVTSGGAVALAQSAGPDDVLYGVKRASEQAWMTVPRNPQGQARAHLTLAERRADEAAAAPGHAAQLIADGLEHVEAASGELPEQAIATFERLLGTGDDSLPAHASPAARAAIHRNCVRIATRHGLDAGRCGPAPTEAHPGRGVGRDHAPGQQREPGQTGRPDFSDDHPGRGPTGERERGGGTEGPGADAESRPGDAGGPPATAPGQGRGKGGPGGS